MEENKFCRLLDKHTFSTEFLKSFDAVLTDCDGVIWIGTQALPGARETMKFFRQVGKKIIYVTNNSTKSRKDYLKKLETLGFEAHLDEVFSSAFCAALYLRSLKFQQKAYVIGMAGIVEELQEMGIQSLPLGPDIVPEDWIPWIRQGIPMDPEVGAVIVGYDVHISYPKLIRATTYLSRPGCIFIGTNYDGQFPSEGNVVLPGTGSLVAAVTCAAEREPIVMGKPSKFMFECIQMVHPDLVPEKCLMIGDRLSTDIVFGRKLSMQTLLVLTGINTLEDAQSKMKSTNPADVFEVPHYYSPSLNEVASHINT